MQIIKLVILFAFMFKFAPALAEVPAHDHKCAAEWPKADYPYHWKANQCGPDDWRHKFIPNKLLFGDVDIRPACDGHDRCTMTIGKGHSECVGEMLDHMEKICRKTYPSIAQTPLREACYFSVSGVARSVQAFGADSHWGGQREQKKFEDCVAEHGYQPRTAFRCKNGTCVPKMISAYSRDDLHEEREEYCKTNCTMNQMVRDEFVRRTDIERAEFERHRPRIEIENRERIGRMEKYGALYEMSVESLEKLVDDMEDGKIPRNELAIELMDWHKTEWANDKRRLNVEVEYNVYVFQEIGRPIPKMLREEVKRRGIIIKPDELKAKYYNKGMSITETLDGTRTVTFQ